MAAILNSAIMNLAIFLHCDPGFSHPSSSSQTHSHLPRLVSNISTKNFTHSFWLNLMIAVILTSAILDSTWIPPILYKKIFTHSFWLNLMVAAILNYAILYSANLHKKNFTHSFSLNLMMAAILNSAMLDSDTAILDSNTLLSSLRFTQKHSSSTVTLTQTNSIWLS